MNALKPEAPRPPRRDLFAPLGVLLVLSGIVAIVLAAITRAPLVSPAGAFLVVSGIGLVVASEYRDEADLDYSRFLGLRVKVRKNAAAAEERPLGPGERPQLEVIKGEAKVDDGGCRLTQALNRLGGGG